MFENFYDKSEELCDSLLEAFNRKHDIFKVVYRHMSRSRIDCMCKDHEDNMYAVEMKKRNCTADKYDTMFIECSKFWVLYEQYVLHGYTPIYLCFMDDCTLWFDLRDIDPMSIELVKRKIYNQGSEREEVVYRYLLPINKAKVYK